MKIVVTSPSSVSLIGGAEVKTWRERHKVWISGAEFTQKYKRGYWDGFTRPGVLSYTGNSTWKLVIPRGMLPTMLKEFDTDAEYQYTLPPDFDLVVGDHGGHFDLKSLRDYQLEALELIFEKQWGRIALATNAGKGAIIGIAAGMMASQCGTVLILTDEVSVFDALKTEVTKWGGLTMDFVESGRNDPPNGTGVVLAMIPTLAKRIGREKKQEKRHKQHRAWLKWLGTVDMCLLDEADRASAATWQDVLGTMPNNYFRVGFSGSFDTQNAEKEMIQKTSIGDVLIQIKNKELIDRNISARPLVQLVRYAQTFDPPAAELWYALTGPERRLLAYETGVLFNEDRHQLIMRLLETDAQNAIVVNRVDHGHALVKVIPDSIFLHGSDSKEYRQEVLKKFGEGGFQNLITTKILDRGTNLLGHAVGLLFVSGEGSKTQTLQRVGRGLRKTGGKDYLFLKDIIDTPPSWAIGGRKLRVNPYEYFVNASRKRIALYNKEAFEVEIINGA